MNKTTLIGLAVICVLVGALSAWAINTYVIQTTGTYEGNLEISPTSFNWGTLTQNVNVTKSANITNHGNAVTLNFSYDEPVGFNTTLYCDAENYPLAKGETVQANFTLTIHNGTAGTFNFKIYVEPQ